MLLQCKKAMESVVFSEKKGFLTHGQYFAKSAKTAPEKRKLKKAEKTDKLNTLSSPTLF